MLRYGLVIHDGPIPAWQSQAIDYLRVVPDSQCVVVLVRSEAAARKSLATWVSDGFAVLDRTVFPSKRDPMANTDVSAQLREVPHRALAAGWHPDDGLVLIINLTALPIAGEGPAAPATATMSNAPGPALPVGIWSLGFGPSLHGDSAAVGLSEVVVHADTAQSALVARFADGTATVLYQSYAPTHEVSVNLSRALVLWKSATFFARALHQANSKDRAPAQQPAQRAQAAGAQHHVPLSAASIVVGLSRQCARFAWQRATHRWQPEKWTMAYRVDPPSRSNDEPCTTLDKLTWLLPPRDRFWADPFVVRDSQSWYVFFEESIRGLRRAHLCGMRIDEHGPCELPFRIMERDFHLSYPFVFTWQGTWWMVPETSRNQTVELWRADNFPRQWKLERVLLQGVSAVDATLHEHDGRWWMFCNLAEPGASSNDELAIFHAPSPLGPWQPHRRNPIRSDVRNTRPAGRIFQRDGAWIRPAQNCAGRYGSSIVLQRMDRLDVDDYHETPIGEIVPNAAQGQTGVHTINAAAGLTIFDVRRRVAR